MNKIIGVRISKEDRELLDKVCKARGEGLSSFVRRSIRKEFAMLSFLSDDDKKALGVKVIRPEEPPKRKLKAGSPSLPSTDVPAQQPPAPVRTRREAIE